MKRRVLIILFAMMLMTTSCGKTTQENTVCRCTCGGCTCGPHIQETNQEVVVEDANELLGMTSQTSAVPSDDVVNITTEVESTTIETQGVEASEMKETQEVESLIEAIEEQKEVKELTEGEKEARRQFMQQLAQQRENLYALPNSVEKTNQIAQIDTMIIENSVYDFSDKTICFVGDSITEAICGKLDEDGNRISYVDYVQDYLTIGDVLNRGMAGRMFSSYGGDDYSLSKKLDRVLYPLSNATVVFLGVNDYLSELQDKRFGEQNVDSYSDAGYCGSLRATMKYLKNNFGNQDIFFVLVYNVDRQVNATYTDVTPMPTLEDFLDIQKSYAEHYGFHVIDIYSTGIMDLSDAKIEATYTPDGIHPNDKGNIVLAQHIAAELALYYSNK